MKRKIFKYIILSFSIFVFVSCLNDSKYFYSKGYIHTINWEHWGRGYYRQVVYFNYVYNNDTIEIRKELYKWDGQYNEGDSIKIKVNKRNLKKVEVIY